jgi:hypothetical protein
MEIVVILQLSKETAKDLNKRKCDGVILSKVHPGQHLEAIMGKTNNPEKIKSFVVPKDKEYVIIDLG